MQSKTILTFPIGYTVGLILIILNLKSIISIFSELVVAIMSGKFIHIAKLVLSTLVFYLSTLVICGYLGIENKLGIFPMLPFFGLCNILFFLKLLSSIIINLPDMCDNVLYNIVETLKKSSGSFRTYIICLLWSLIVQSNCIYSQLKDVISGNTDNFRNNLSFLCCGTLVILALEHSNRLFNLFRNTEVEDNFAITGSKGKFRKTTANQKDKEFPNDIENTETEHYAILNGEKIRIQ